MIGNWPPSNEKEPFFGLNRSVTAIRFNTTYKRPWYVEWRSRLRRAYQALRGHW